MNKFKLPLIVFSIVFIATAGILFYTFNKEMPQKGIEEAHAPGWVNNDGSSGRIELGEVPTFNMKSEVENKTKETTAATTSRSEAKKQNETAEKQVATEKNADADKQEPQGLKIVTDIFLNNLAEYTVSCFYPAGALPRSPTHDITTITLRSINNYFGLNLRGLVSEAPSLLSARDEIWKTLLTPGNMQTAYDSYSDRFIDLLEEKGITAERKFSTGAVKQTRSLTTAERISLFRVSAIPLRQTAMILNTIASNSDLIKAMDGYIKAQLRVESANAVFQNALSESNSIGSVSSKNKATHAGKLLKEAITVREKIKNGISEKINSLCGGQCDSTESFYTAQWVYRRTRNSNYALKSILAGADLLSRIADKMEKRADLIAHNM